MMMFSGNFALAEENEEVKFPSPPEIGVISSVREQPEKISTKSLSRIKYRADQLIKERINTLEANKKVVVSSKSLTLEQQKTITGIIDKNIQDLTLLKGTIASSTDATSTRILTESIFTKFRIYGIVVPQVRLEKRIFELQNHSVKISETFIKVQSRIDEYKGKGRDVTAWQKSIDDAKVQVALNMNTLAILLTKVSALTPSDYGTTSKMVIESANKEIKTVAKDFSSIAKTLNKPKQLKNIGSVASTTRR